MRSSHSGSWSNRHGSRFRWRAVGCALLAGLVVATTTVGATPEPSSAQASSPEVPLVSTRPDADGAVSVPAPVVNGRRSPGPAPEVSVRLAEDGRTSVVSDVAEVERPAAAVAEGWGGFAVSETVRPEDVGPRMPPNAGGGGQPGGNTPEGFVPGRSVYRGAEEGGRVHVWDNADGTVSVNYFEFPTEIDERTGRAVDPAPGLTRRPGADRFERVEGDTTVSVAAQTTAIAARPAGASGPSPRSGGGPLMSLALGSDTIGFDVAGQRTVAGVRRDDGAVVFAGLLAGVDAVAQATATGMKIDYVVDDVDAALGLFETLELPVGWTAVERDGGIVLVDGSGVERARWGGGTAHDARGEGSGAVDVRVRLVGAEGRSVTAQVVVDEEWLRDPARVFPVTIDPWVAYIAASMDTWIGPDIADPKGSEVMLRVGTEGGFERQSLLQVTSWFPNDPALGVPVVSATLALAKSYMGNCAAQNLSVRRAGSVWNEATTWPTRPGSAYHGEGDVSYSGCNNNYIGVPVTNMVQYWANNPASSFGFLLHAAPGAPYRSFFSSNYGDANFRPYLQVTYQIPSAWGARYIAPAAVQGIPSEAVMPRPGTVYNPAHAGQVPVYVTNTGALNWSSGFYGGNLNPPPGNNVCLAYHVIGSGAPEPALSAGAAAWEVFEGIRTCPAVGQSNMFDFWNAVNTNPNGRRRTISPFVPLLAQIANSNQATPGVKDVYFTMVHEGFTWFEWAGVPRGQRLPVRWTDPPTMTTPVPGAVVSALDDPVFTWAKPHAGTGAEWTPSQYRLRVYVPGGTTPLYEQVVAGTVQSATVPVAALGDNVGTLVWVLQARDGSIEQPGAVQMWTQAASGGFFRQPANLGDSAFAETFSGVDPSVGNLHSEFVDFAPSTASGQLDLVRHLNSQDRSRGIFGPGFSTKWEMSFHCASSCVDADDPRVFTKADGSQVYFSWDPADNRLEAQDGSEAHAVLAGPNWVMTFKDGSRHEFKAVTGMQWGDLAKIVDSSGRSITVLSDPSSGFPTEVIDDASGRKITFVYTSHFPFLPTDRVVDYAVLTGGTAPSVTVDYSYTITQPGTYDETRWLDQSCTATVACTSYDWTPGGRIDLVTWPSNGRLSDPSYHPNGKVSTIVDGWGASTSFVYNSGSTVVTDARGKVWTVEFNAFGQTTKLIDPAGGQTVHVYTDGRRTTSTDPAGHSSVLTYDADGNLLTETNAAGETTYRAYNPAHYGNQAIKSGPSHECDARSTTGASGQFCTERRYDAAGRMTMEQGPGETRERRRSGSTPTGRPASPAIRGCRRPVLCGNTATATPAPSAVSRG